MNQITKIKRDQYKMLEETKIIMKIMILALVAITAGGCIKMLQMTASETKTIKKKTLCQIVLKTRPSK